MAHKPSDELEIILGQLAVKLLELLRRVKERSIDPKKTRAGLQKLIEGKSFVRNQEPLCITVDNVSTGLDELLGILKKEGVYISREAEYLLHQKKVRDFSRTIPIEVHLTTMCSDNLCDSATLVEQSQRNSLLANGCEGIPIDSVLKAVIYIVQSKIDLFSHGIGALVFRDDQCAKNFIALSKCGESYTLSVVQATEPTGIFYHWVVWN